MSSPVLPFPAADQRQWLQSVVKTLQNASPESLNHVDEDGLTVAALYQIDPLLETAEQASGLAPITRLTAEPAQRLAHGWKVHQPVDATVGAALANKHLLEELESGVSGISLMVDSTSAIELERILQSVVIGATDLILDAGNDVINVVTEFKRYANQEKKHISDFRLDLAIDPFAPHADSSLLNDSLILLKKSNADDMPDGVFRLNGWRWHNQGISNVQELAYLLAAATQVFRTGMALGLTAAEVSQKMSLSVALPADLFDGIAKCRAIRRGWSGLVLALGLDAKTNPLRLHAAPSLRMFSLADTDINILRTTTALLGGAIGGADMMSAFAHDTLAGSSANGRRLARMQQLIMIEESGLGRSLDPAGGSAFIEARTEDLVSAAWTAFQDTEATGGALAAHSEGRFEKISKCAASDRYQRVINGETSLLGVTLQPNDQPISTVLSCWRGIRRPAAWIEAIRYQTALTPPRILIFQQPGTDNLCLEKIRTLLKIGGMSGTLLTLSPDNLNAITLARVDAVIIINSRDKDWNTFVRETLHKRGLSPVIFEGKKLLQNDGKLHWLASLAATAEWAR